MPGSKLPDYTICGKYDGSGPAARWLARLAYDMRRADNPVDSPADFFEAVEILFDGEAATWLDSSPKYRRLVDQRARASQADVEDFKEALMAEFPNKVMEYSETNVYNEMQSFAQSPNEALQSYYKRAQHLLRRAHGRDDPRDPLAKQLEPAEVTILVGMVSAFIGGLHDEYLRGAVLAKSATTCGSLSKALEIIQETQSSINNAKEFEQKAAEKRELEQYRAVYGPMAGAFPYPSQYPAPFAGHPITQLPSVPTHRPQSASYNTWTQNYGVHHPQSTPYQAYGTAQYAKSQPQTQLESGALIPLDNKDGPGNVAGTGTTGDVGNSTNVGGNYGNGRGNYSGVYRGGRGAYQGNSRYQGGRVWDDQNAGSRNQGGQSRDGGGRDSRPRKPIPPKNLSRNPFINGSVKYDKSSGPLCLNCGEAGHYKPDCKNDSIELWEQAYLKELIYGGLADSYLINLEYSSMGPTGNTAPSNPISRTTSRSSSPSRYGSYSSRSGPMIYTPSESEADICLEDFARIELQDRPSHGAGGKLNALGFRPTPHEQFPDLSAFAGEGANTRKRARLQLDDDTIEVDHPMYEARDEAAKDPGEKAAKKSHKRG
jgi:hypothetical protein